jgi:hypothetical protein
MIDLNQYFPINTTEKVDAIIGQLKSQFDKNQKNHYLKQLEIDICINIRKAKFQSYFKTKFNEFLALNNSVKQPEKPQKSLSPLATILRDCNNLLSFLKKLDKATPEILKKINAEYARINHSAKNTKKPEIIMTQLSLLKNEINKYRQKAKIFKPKPSKKVVYYTHEVTFNGVTCKFEREKEINREPTLKQTLKKNKRKEKEINKEPTLKQILEERKENERKEQEYILTNPRKFIPMTYLPTETEEDPLHRK